MYPKWDAKSHNTTRPLLILIIGLGIGVFFLDLYLPLGIGNSVLYGGLVILSFLLPYRRGPLITAIICSTVDMTDIMLKPTLDGNLAALAFLPASATGRRPVTAGAR